MQYLRFFDKIPAMEREKKEKTASKTSWLAAPAVFAIGVAALLATWAALEPSRAMELFDADGRSPFELATLPFYAAIIPAVVFLRPFSGSPARRRILTAMTVVVAAMAIVKELDLHNAALHRLYPAFVGPDGSLLPGLFKPNGAPLSGTPFKMRTITNGAVPSGMKALIIAYFTLFFGLFAAGFAYLFKRWLTGVFKLDAASWFFGCFGASGVMVQIADRLPSWLRHTDAALKSAECEITASRSLCTVLEEGGEMMIAVFAILTIVASARALRCPEASDGEKRARA